jgi:hypothetical protein
MACDETPGERIDVGSSAEGERMKCVVDGCQGSTEKEGHTLCYNHWKAQKTGAVRQCVTCRRWLEMSGTVCGDCAAEAADGEGTGSGALLSSTKLGERLQMPARRVNLLLAELGWIEKHVKGWRVTEQGRKVGGLQKEARQTGIPYAIWPMGVVGSKVFQAAVSEARGEADVAPASEPAISSAPAATAKAMDFRSRFPAAHRSTDGHLVRSRAEMLIDNWLYMQQIAHAYERKLPVEEDVYCDFYLPAGKVYIEYWGMEKDPAYAARMQEKKAVYARHGFNLVELTDQDILTLDDVLPRLLLKFGISSD